MPSIFDGVQVHSIEERDGIRGCVGGGREGEGEGEGIFNFLPL
jgi:hypothetical protein